jgi:VIT1/CCC1 family predicted Fe2+/Mn2+ transporter
MTPHLERHFTSGESVRDVVIGMSDGLTVPFALAAGLSGAVSSTGIVVTAGLAEIAAGSIAMGLGGYLAARSDAEHYATERAREEREVREKPAAESAEVQDVLVSYGAYVVGGFVPLGPYLACSSVRTGLLYSVALTLLALAVFGYVKGHFTGTRPVRSAIQTIVIGGLAAAAAFAIARAIS